MGSDALATSEKSGNEAVASRRRGCALAASSTLMVASGFVTIPMAGLGVMFTANCNDADDRILCSSVGVPLLLGAPIVGLVGGLALSGISAVTAHRRNTSLTPWVLLGWGTYGVGFLLAIVLTAQEQSPESKDAEWEMLRLQDERRRAEFVGEVRARPNLEEALPRLRRLRSQLDDVLISARGSSPKWTPLEGTGSCRQHGVPAVNRVTTAEFSARNQWQAVREVVSRFSARHRMSSGSDAGIKSRDVYVAEDGTQISVEPDEGRLELTLFSECRVTAALRAELPPS